MTSLDVAGLPSLAGKLVKGMGGAMDLVASGSKVIVTMEHTDKKGNSKVLPACTLPITGVRCVSMLVTERAVFDIDTKDGKMTLTEYAPGETVESIRAVTEAEFDISPELREFRTS